MVVRSSDKNRKLISTQGLICSVVTVVLIYKIILLVENVLSVQHSSTLYAFTNAIIAIVSAACLVVVCSRVNLRKVLYLAISVVGVLVIAFAVPCFISKSESQIYTYTVWCTYIISGICCGIVIVESGLSILYCTIRRANFLVVVLLTAITIMSPGGVLHGDVLTYQDMSYIGSIVCITQSLTILRDSSIRAFRDMAHNTIVLVWATAVVMTWGGRGAIIIAIIAFAISVYGYARLINIDSRIVIGIVCCFALLICVIMLDSNMMTLIFDGLKRFGEMFQLEKYSNKSYAATNSVAGRLMIYDDSVNLIGSNPLFGYGIFRYLDYAGGYPHNIIIEVLLQGGVVLLICFCCVMYVFVKDLIEASRNPVFQVTVLPLCIYQFTMLMFSGDYMTSFGFWFLLTAVIAFDVRQRATRCPSTRRKNGGQ